MKKILSAALVLVLVLSIAGCAKEEKKIVLASKPMTEQYILVEMLTYLIEKHTDITVEQKLGIGGGTSNIHPAMVSGEIDMYPEYTGTGWLFVLKEELITDPQALYEAVGKAYEEEYGIVWSGLYGFNNTFGIAMKEERAAEMGIETYTELAPLSGGLNFGAGYDFYERDDGYNGMAEAYGFDFETTEMDLGLRYEAIDSGQVDAIIAFSTDGRLEEYNLKVLQDDLNYFTSYYAATLTRQETLTKYPELIEVLALLDGQISDQEMIRMNYLVEIENEDPAKVAEDFLKEKGLY